VSKWVVKEEKKGDREKECICRSTCYWTLWKVGMLKLQEIEWHHLLLFDLTRILSLMTRFIEFEPNVW